MTNDILTLEDVAKYLRIAERTVYDWAQKGKIPGGKIGTSWRFKRSDIARWVDEQLGRDNETADTDAPVSLDTILAPDRILRIQAADKQGAFASLVSSLSALPEITDPAEFEQAMFDRDALLSTSIGRGTGVPHVRLKSVTGMVMAAGICRAPLPDYTGMDGTPVQFIFMIAAPADRHAAYLQALALISARARNERFGPALLQAPDRATAYGIITAHI